MAASFSVYVRGNIGTDAYSLPISRLATISTPRPRISLTMTSPVWTGALCCYLPRLAQAAPYWPQREALCQTALQFLDRADVLFLEESDLLLLFGSRELRTALFALFTGHVQLIFFYKKDRILAFTRSVMASAAKKDQSPALVLYRMEKMGIHVIDLPRLREHVLEQLLSNDANTTECQGLPY